MAQEGNNVFGNQRHALILSHNFLGKCQGHIPFYVQLKMSDLTNFSFRPVLGLFLDSSVIISFQNHLFLNFQVLFRQDGPLFSVMSIFLILRNCFQCQTFFVLIFEHFTVSKFGILLQLFCSNLNYNFQLVELFFDVEQHSNSDIYQF